LFEFPLFLLPLRIVIIIWVPFDFPVLPFLRHAGSTIMQSMVASDKARNKETVGRVMIR